MIETNCKGEYTFRTKLEENKLIKKSETNCNIYTLYVYYQQIKNSDYNILDNKMIQ